MEAGLSGIGMYVNGGPGTSFFPAMIIVNGPTHRRLLALADESPDFDTMSPVFVALAECVFDGTDAGDGLTLNEARAEMFQQGAERVVALKITHGGSGNSWRIILVPAVNNRLGDVTGQTDDEDHDGPGCLSYIGLAFAVVVATVIAVGIRYA